VQGRLPVLRLVKYCDDGQNCLYSHSINLNKPQTKLNSGRQDSPTYHPQPRTKRCISFNASTTQEMNFLDAQKQLAEIVKSASAKVNAYYWRLSGDHPNSLCKFLGLEEEELKVILRLCHIYKANSNDAVSKNNFESLMTMCERGPTFDWGKYNVGSNNSSRLVEVVGNRFARRTSMM
jgi:hypothetical protein